MCLQNLKKMKTELNSEFTYTLKEVCNRLEIQTNQAFVEYCRICNCTDPSEIEVLWQNSNQGDAILLTAKQTNHMINHFEK